jgi:hypothetical protein
MKTGAMRQLVKIGFLCHILTVRQGSGLYIHYATKGHTSGKIPYVHYVGSQGEPNFLSAVCLFFDS